MRKLFVSVILCLLALGAWAEETEINAVKFEQGATVDWYLLSETPTVTVGNGVITIDGKTYDLSKGSVTTTFGVKPITPTAIDNMQTSSDGKAEASKFFYNGQLYILRDGKIYSATGSLISTAE